MSHASVNMDEVNEQTGFLRAEEYVWNAYARDYLAARDRDGDVDAWVDAFCEQAAHDGVTLERAFVKAVCVLGLYAGPRDEFQQRSGCGKAVYANGDRYEGDFFEGKKHGCGRYVFASVRKSEADRLVEAAVRRSCDGGILSPHDNDAVARMAAALSLGRHIVAAIAEYGYHPYYHGDYVHGKRCGQGIFKHKDASVYKGDFRDNKRDGQGVYYYLNGDIFSGHWRNGRKHGYGAYHFADGGEYRGEWVDGVLRHGQWLLPHGTYYEGAFDRHNRPRDDAATMHYPALAMTQCGTFRRGVWAPTSALYACDETPVDATAWIE